MSRTLFRNVMVFDGTGQHLFPGEVLIEGNRIAAVNRSSEPLSSDGCAVVDGKSGTLMPGLIEAHAHLTFTSAVDRIEKMGDPATEHHVFTTYHNAKTLLDHGFTSAYSGGATKPAVEVAVREEIEAGYVPGPRLRASSFERNLSGANPMEFGRLDDVQKWATDMIGLGVDSLKLVLNGRAAMEPAYWNRINYGDDELAAVVKIARENDITLSCHAMTADAVKMAVNAGFHAIYHCNFADEEALDMLESKKDRVFVAPAVGILVVDAYERFATRKEAENIGAFEALEGQVKVIPQMRKRGIRVLPGGDYGFPWNPVGRNARDLDHFVKYFGFQPNEVLRAATQYGGQIMQMGDELGLIKEGYLADLLLIDGDPLKDVTLLQNKDNILAIMKDGSFYKQPATAPH